MKNISLWKETKFILNKKGKAIANKNYVGSGSIHIASLVAREYQMALPIYAKGNLLDLGCGTVPFYNFYKEYVDNVTCVDWENSLHETSFIDFTRDLNQPLNINTKFNTIILSDVLEHIYEPKKLLSECYDILENNSYLILNTPFSYWEHEVPFDYYRYTQFFFRKVAEDIGFSIEYINPIGARNIDVIHDIVAKTYQKDQFKTNLVVTLLKKILPKKVINEPLGYFVVFKKHGM